MIACHCKGISVDTVIEAATTIDEAAAEHLEEVGRRCGAGTDCGGCVATLEEILAGHCPGYARCAVVGSSVPAA